MCKTKQTKQTNKQTNKQTTKKGMDNILKMSQVHATEGLIGRSQLKGSLGRSQLHACNTRVFRGSCFTVWSMLR